MKKWWLILLLFLSVGFNLGLLFSAGFLRGDRAPEPVRGSTPVSAPSEGEPVQGAPEPDRGVQPSSQQPVRTEPEERAAAAAAQPPPRAVRPVQQRPMEFDRLAERLGLEGEQRQRFLLLHARLGRRVRQLGPRLQQLRRELFQELTASPVDEERIRQLVTQLGRGNVEVERTLVQVVLETRQMLNEEQQRLYVRFLQTRMGSLMQALNRGGNRQADEARRRAQQRRQQQR